MWTRFVIDQPQLTTENRRSNHGIEFPCCRPGSFVARAQSRYRRRPGQCVDWGVGATSTGPRISSSCTAFFVYEPKRCITSRLRYTCTAKEWEPSARQQTNTCGRTV
ncbi:hypothetical protein LIA77_09994 [Sarocladium implicatum]|nr:hypothetical protein LIA77_09994 [Sarocladium implicatum]